MTIARGVSVGPYEILSRIGAGGMGEVWRARDRRIGRDVAVKVLPEEFNDEAMRRFEQEARAAGSLNHPGLVTIYDVGTKDSAPYIVMELLEGETLRDAIGEHSPVALPLRRAIDYAAQIAAALAVAHEKGIIHRDLKPENIFITSDRRVKILDFGLAKLAAGAKDVDGRTRTSRHLTGAGIAIGTPAYMSPEQVRADPIDHRTDIFSLGTVIYEMLTGKAPFECFSAVETMHAVLSVEAPPLETAVPHVSPALEAIVRHCMEKDPRERFQSARDLAFQLRTLPEMQASATGTRHPAIDKRRRPYRAALLIVPLILAAAIGGFLVRGSRRSAPESTLRTFKQLTFADGVESFPTLAPDGKSFAFVSEQSGNEDIYVQRVDGRTAINITSDSPDNDYEPAFSPDGSKIAFRSERDGGGIFVMGVTGESVRRVTEKGQGHNPSWSPDGTRIVYSTLGVGRRPHIHRDRGDLWIIDIGSQSKRLLFDDATPGLQSDALQPSWSPNGKRIAFWGLSSSDRERHIWTIDPDAKEPLKTLVRATSDLWLNWNPVWSPDGRYLYYGSDRNGTLSLWRLPIDQTTGKPTAPPEAFPLPAPVTGLFTVSQQGEVAFATSIHAFRLLAIPFDASSGKTGEARTLFGGSERVASFEPSPDGKTMAFMTGGGSQEDLFIANIDGTRVRQLTNDAAKDRGVTWAPDGKTLYFYSNRDGAYQIWSIRSDGSLLRPITNQRDLERIRVQEVSTPDASPDGRTLTARTVGNDVLVHLDRPIGQRLETLPREIKWPQWSADGKLLLGVAGGSRNFRVTVYSPQTRQLKQVPAPPGSPRWLPGSNRVVLFHHQSLSILSLDTGLVTSTVPTAFTTPTDTVHLSPDGSLLYVKEELEQGDVWIMRPGRE